MGFGDRPEIRARDHLALIHEPEPGVIDMLTVAPGRAVGTRPPRWAWSGHVIGPDQPRRTCAYSVSGTRLRPPQRANLWLRYAYLRRPAITIH